MLANPPSLKLGGGNNHPSEARQSPEQLVELEKELNVSLEHSSWSVSPPIVETVDPLQVYPPLMLPDFNEEEMVEEEVDEIPEKSLEVAGELVQEIAKDGATTTEDGVAAKGASPNLSTDLLFDFLSLRCEFPTLEVPVAADPVRMMFLSDTAVVRLLSLSRRSPPRLRLALRISRRFVLEGVQLARRRPWRDCLPPPSHHPWPIGAPARPVEGHRAKRKPFEVKSTLIGVESSLVRSVSKQISHSHSPRRRLTVGSAFPTRSGRVSDELPRKKRRFAVLREIRHRFARFLQLRSKLARDLYCLLFQASQGKGFDSLVLSSNDSASVAWLGFTNLLSTRICANLANWVCSHSMVMSRLPPPPRSNQLRFCLKLALGIL
ncbi:hypothetical protein Acr_08g0008090 [Actinidia rufa]|uniref:Uncharacterized protein n=1 Tax=Actinidia rufa TaxID=165716 RepID=A0A7J0F1B9_9ERIC|nr:hypothetical protein Acr_08g0008090 [Actinidia rufa]